MTGSRRTGVTFGLLVVGSLLLSLFAPVQSASGVTETDGGFEDGTVGSWQGTQDDGGVIGAGSIQAVRSAVDARFGEWFGLVTYVQHGGGAMVELVGLEPGVEYVTEGWLKDPSASGSRFRVGVEGAESASHSNAYEEGGFHWAELGNVAQGTGSSTGTYQEFVLTFVAAGESARIYVVFEDAFSAPGEFYLDDWTTNITCGDHCDCPQGEFCHRGKCRYEPDAPVLKCSQDGCMPGQWCVECDGRRSTCGADPNWDCGDACDCGPGWCCKDGECFKDLNDPYFGGLVGGEILESPCVQGVDPTFCQDDPACWAGQLAYVRAEIDENFRCVDPDTGEVSDTCLQEENVCFFNCAGGFQCLDVRAEDLLQMEPGTLTTLLGGGCISDALAESVFGWPASELVSEPCFLADGEPNPRLRDGERCKFGWRPGTEVLIQRIVGEEGSCGNGICEFEKGETAAWCSDCTESSQVCGDGVCQCDGAVAENAQNCPDCADEPDLDSDGLPDKCDGCPLDAAKTEPGVCGCGQSETDTDGDGVPDCVDNCPDTANTDQADFDGDGIGDACDTDSDGDGVANDDDFCPWTVLNYMPEDLKKNRYFADAFGQFIDANGSDSGFTTVDTYGCGELQIIDLMELGLAHERFGITRSVLLKFIEEFQDHAQG